MSQYKAKNWSGRWMLIAIALFAMGLASSAQANTMFTYTGNDYTSCAGSYCVGGPYALSVSFVTTLTGNALDNLPFTDITPTITSFAFTDGSGLKVDQNTLGGYAEINISTDASGNIVTWLTGGYADSSQVQMQTNWHSPFGFIPGADFSETTANFAGSWGFVNDDPGTWMKSEVPEPATLVLLSAGLAINGARRLAKRSH
jgi:hypothetical protein